MDDRQLVQGMIDGDEDAFEVFADTFIPALYRFAFFRLDRNRELTCDIVQSTVCKAIAKLSSFRGEAALMTWLCACCRTEIAMHFRKEGRRGREVELTERSLTELAPTQRQAPRGADGALLQGERRLHVHIVLDLLKPHYRRVLAWKYFEELSVKEIAQRLDVGPKAAESLLTRARRSFREAHERLLSSFESRGKDS